MVITLMDVSLEKIAPALGLPWQRPVVPPDGGKGPSLFPGALFLGGRWIISKFLGPCLKIGYLLLD